MKYPNVRAEMSRHGKTIQDIAKYLGLSTNSVSFKLNGKREFTLKEVENLASLFNCSLDYLVARPEI